MAVSIATSMSAIGHHIPAERAMESTTAEAIANPRAGVKPSPRELLTPSTADNKNPVSPKTRPKRGSKQAVRPIKGRKREEEDRSRRKTKQTTGKPTPATKAGTKAVTNTIRATTLDNNDIMTMQRA